MAKVAQKGFASTFKVGANTAGKAKDVKLSASGKEIDISTRSGAGWEEFLQGPKSWDVDIGMLWVADDVSLVAIRDAFLNGTSLAIQILDAVGDGVSGNAIVTSIGIEQGYADAVMFPIKLKGSGALTVVTAA